MSEAALDLRGAIGIEATPDRSEIAAAARHTLNFTTALRAALRKFEMRFLAGAFSENHAHHRRDDLSGFFDGDRIADADVFAAKLVLVVQRGARDGAAGEEDRFQL